MATGIPLPGQPINSLLTGVNTGSSMFSRLMQPIMERQKMAQQAEQFKQDIALRKAAAARAGANSDIQRQVLQEQLIGLKHGNDPNWALQQKLNALRAFGMGDGSTPTPPAPQDAFGEGQGMFTPEGLQDAQQVPETPTGGMGGFNQEQFKKNPLLRFLFKQQFGTDPLAVAPQTPEEKQSGQLDLFKQKEALKAQNKGGDTPTNAVLTQNQQAIQGIDTVLPMLDDLIKNPNKIYGRSDFSPSKKAAYNAKTSGMIDTLIAAQSLPKVQASIDLVEQQIRRGTNEADEAYIERLKDLRKDLASRRSKTQSVLQSRKINTAPMEDFSSMSDEELHKIAGGG